MDACKLTSFIKRIITTSPDRRSALEALEQLKNILNSQLERRDQELFSDALEGIEAEFGTMKSTLQVEKTGPDIIRASREAAKKRRTELDERHGRC